MTLREVETILNTLEARHPQLDEAMLTTLLTAGGWDERTIADAVVLFRGKGKSLSAEKPEVLLVPTEASHVLPEMIDETHELLEHNPQEELPVEPVIESVEGPAAEEVLPIPAEATVVVPEVVPEITKYEVAEIKVSEPQSLIEPVEYIAAKEKSLQKVEAEIPHNLPLRPFESTESVWPFSRYKDIFFGEIMPTPKVEEGKDVKEAVKVVEKEKIIEKHIVIDNVRIAKTPLTGKDEKIIALAAAMLVVILLLLGYMYSNARF
ncbi:MAG: hypothetical protein WC444_02595 [Candidatus Paceibacterota bacterium]